jgi:hypothetical protein
LSDAAGVEIDRVAFGEQTRDHSFGRTDGGEWRYFLVPTPEAPNEGPSFSNALPDAVAFSPDSGRFSSPFQLRLELNRPGSGEVVRYTLDGSAPTATSLVYTAPITVGSNTVFSAAGFADGVRATPVSARSYFFGGSFQLPVLSISMNPVDYFDLHTSETGRGRLSEKPAFLEYFEPVLQRAAAVPMGLRLHGGAGRGGDFETKKSYRCYFRGEYGMRRFNYPIIPDAPEPEFDRLVLRAGFNDAFRTSSRAAYIRDQLIRGLHEDMGGIVAHGSWCDLFVNMKFRGLYNVVERIDERFLAAATGEKDWDVIRTGNEVVSGTADEWDRLRAFCLQNDLAQESNYRIAETMVDVPNFTSYMLVNIWAQNHDWISNNWYAARPRRSDGKWIFLCWDAEFGVGLIPPGSSANTFEFVFERSGNLRDIFESLLASPIFRSFFAEEADRHAYGALIRENIVRHIDLLVEKVAGDIPEEVALYGQPVSRWAANVEECRGFAGSRLPVFLDSILKSTRFEFPEVRTPRITGCEPGAILNRGEQSVTLTGVRLTESTLVFFNDVPAASVEPMGPGRVRAELPFDLSLEGPITIHARNEPGGTTSATDGLLSILLPRPVAVQIVPARGSSGGGDRVRIDGASFLPGVRVEFDGVPAPDVAIVPDSPQALEIVTPPGSGDANVVVWNPVVGGAVPSFSRLKFTYIEQRFRRGDANGDGRVDVSDPISILGYLFSGDAALPCSDAADANDTGIVDLSDAVYTLVFLFQGGREPPSPFTACGEDATSDALACDYPRGCES